MSYLIDTCVLSECVKKSPNPLIAQWFNQQQTEQLFISSLTLAELKKGIYKIEYSQPERYKKLQDWLYKIEMKFYLRLLPVNDPVLSTWAKLSANAELHGKKLAVIDSLIAATALEFKLSLVTRNTRDFEYTGVKLLNPWELNHASN
jgi:predicted nucleic acid-binding protein